MFLSSRAGKEGCVCVEMQGKEGRCVADRTVLFAHQHACVTAALHALTPHDSDRCRSSQLPAEV